MFPTACGPGSYQPLLSQVDATSCQKCPAGTVCPFYGLRHAETAIFCEFGEACPEGTRWKYEFPCPAGTYSDVTSLIAVDGCLKCPERFACP